MEIKACCHQTHMLGERRNQKKQNIELEAKKVLHGAGRNRVMFISGFITATNRPHTGVNKELLAVFNLIRPVMSSEMNREMTQISVGSLLLLK